MGAVKNLLIRGGADFSSMKREVEKANKALKSLKENTRKSMNVVKTILGTALSMVALKTVVSDAMKVESAIQQISRIMAESSNQFLKWASTSAEAFNLSKSEAIRYGAVFGNLVAVFSSSTTELMTNTVNLLKASSIVASSTGRTMEDVMDRIRSGLLGNTEAIEDLGIYAQVGMLTTTDAFKKFANGKSWNQIDYQTQQQIRLF